MLKEEDWKLEAEQVGAPDEGYYVELRFKDKEDADEFAQIATDEMMKSEGMAKPNRIRVREFKNEEEKVSA